MSQAMNWEYQEFYRNGASGLRISPVGVECIVGVGAMNTGEIAIALCIVPHGSGQIILNTLDILPQLISEKPQSAVAKKLFMNLLLN